MVDYSKLFDLVYFLEFFMACVETGSSSQKGQFLVMSRSIFCSRSGGLARVAIAGTRREMLARLSGAPGARKGLADASGAPSQHKLNSESEFCLLEGLEIVF